MNQLLRLHTASSARQAVGPVLQAAWNPHRLQPQCGRAADPQMGDHVWEERAGLQSENLGTFVAISQVMLCLLSLIIFKNQLVS